MKAPVVLVYLYLIYSYAIVFEIQEKVFKTSVNARPHFFNVSFLENPTEYPHKPYTARN